MKPYRQCCRGGICNQMHKRWCPEGDPPVEVLDLDILLVVAQGLLHAAVVKVGVEAHVRGAAADALPLAAQQLRVTPPLCEPRSCAAAGACRHLHGRQWRYLDAPTCVLGEWAITCGVGAVNVLRSHYHELQPAGQHSLQLQQPAANV